MTQRSCNTTQRRSDHKVGVANRTRLSLRCALRTSARPLRARRSRVNHPDQRGPEVATTVANSVLKYQGLPQL
jgi:hypothetical protein